jgi:hypothetical protein
MSNAAWRATDILGLTPGLDLRRSDKLYAVSGRNFAFTSLGPRSVFGNRFLLPHPAGSCDHVQGIRVRVRTGDRVFTFFGDSILEWNESTGGWDVIYVTPITNLTPYRWTHGYLNDKIFFCHPRTGIIVYDLDSEAVYPHNGPGVPTTAQAICVNNGRLVVMDDVYLSWSWQSDGLNFTPALGEAGQQKINDRVAGFPIMVTNYAQGVLTWTTGGVMRSEFTGDQAVYRHRNLNTEFRPINSFCTLQTDENTCVILDERGLFQSQGGPPEPMTPLFNEFLIDFIRKNKLSIGQNIRIEWDDLRRFMYVSVSFTTEFAIYERAYVLYPSLDKWGVFSEPHYGILPIGIGANQREGSYFGFVDSSRFVRYWSDFASREILPTAGVASLRYPLIQKPSYEEDGGDSIVCASSGIFSSEPTTDVDLAAGYYQPGSSTPLTSELTGLDAVLQVGLIRFDGQDGYDRLSEVLAVMLGNLESGPQDQLSEDYLVVPDGVSDEDYEVVEGAEDFGESPLAYVNHNLRVISTNDGRSLFQQAIPELVAFNEAARHYSCSTSGIWHILEVSADSPGQAFHLQAFELTATDAGRLT